MIYLSKLLFQRSFYTTTLGRREFKGNVVVGQKVRITELDSSGIPNLTDLHKYSQHNVLNI